MIIYFNEEFYFDLIESLDGDLVYIDVSKRNLDSIEEILHCPQKLENIQITL